MTSRARRRVALPVLLLAAVLAFSGSGATAQTADLAGPASLPVLVTVDRLLPRLPRPGGELEVAGTLRSTGAALTGLTLRVRVGERLRTRNQLARADTAPGRTEQRSSQPAPDLPSGAAVPFDLRVPVDDLRLGGQDGVFSLALEVRTRTGLLAGQVATFVPWFAGRPVDPLRLAWVLPVVDRPHRAPREVMADDALATLLAPGGRLSRVLSVGRSGEAPTCDGAANCPAVPVTYVVDADLLGSVQAMTRPYDVLADPVGAAPGTTGGRTLPGTGTAAATGWLSSLRAATGDLLALPYADVDVDALTRPDSPLAQDVQTARSEGVAQTRELLGRDPLPGVELAPPGPLSDAALDALSSGGTRAVLLSEAALPPRPDSQTFTQGARADLPGDPTGLVPDAGLSRLLTAPAPPGGARLAEQRWLVETAMVSAELGADRVSGRTLLVAAPREADLDPAVAGQALQDTARVPWLCPVRLAAVVAGTESCPGGSTPAYGAERDGELQPDVGGPALTPAALGAVASVSSAAEQFTGAILKGGTQAALQTRARLRRAVLRTESLAFRDDQASQARLVGLLAEDVTDLRDHVQLRTQPVTLTSSSGRVSVALVNTLDQPVTVAVRLTAPSDARLATRQPGVVEVPGNSSTQVEIDAETRTSGRFVVRAQLLDRNLHDVGPFQTLVVRSTRYGRVALAITGLAAAVLFVTAGVRLVRRALRSRRVAR